MYLAQNLKYLRERNGEKQKDISSILDVSEMTISRYESGDCEPDLCKVMVLAEHFGITIDEFLSVRLQEDKPLYISNLKYLRRKNEITQQEMAKLLSLRDKSSCSLIESGKTRLSADQMIKLADYFGVTLDQFAKQDLSEMEV